MSLEKKFTKRVLAALAAVTMMFSAAGCGESTSWAVKYGEQTASAGVFTYYQMEALSEAKSLIKKEDENADLTDLKKLKSMKVEGTDIETWVNDKAKQKVKKFLAVNSKFEELGFELSADDKANADYYVEYGWMYGEGDRCEKIGTGKESYRQIVELSYKEKQIFSYYYGEGGEREYPQEDYNKYLTENLSRVKMIQLNLKDGKEEELDEAGKKEIKAMAEDYLKRVNAGEDIEKLIKEYNDYYEKLKEEASAEEETENSEDEEPAVTTEAPAVTTVASGDEEEPEVTSAADEEAASETTTASEESEEEPETTTVSEESEEEPETTTVSEESEEEPETTTVSEESEEEPETTTVSEDSAEEPAVTTEASEKEEPESDDENDDPYKNENLFFKGSEEDGYNPSQVVNEAIFSQCKVGGDAVLVEDEENLMIYVISRYDVLERTDFTEGDYKDYLLWKILEDEFAEFELEWIDESLFKNNNPAFSRYSAFKSEE